LIINTHPLLMRGSIQLAQPLVQMEQVLAQCLL